MGIAIFLSAVAIVVVLVLLMPGDHKAARAKKVRAAILKQSKVMKGATDDYQAHVDDAAKLLRDLLGIEAEREFRDCCDVINPLGNRYLSAEENCAAAAMFLECRAIRAELECLGYRYVSTK